MDTATTATASTDAIGGFLVGSLTTGMIICAVVIWLLTVIAWWKIFTKTGEKGWKSIIPVYSDFVQYKVTWKTKWFWAMLALSLVAGIIASIAKIDTTGETQPALSFPVVVYYILALAAAVIDIISVYKLSKSFGKGVGFFLGLVFFNTIFVLILGFGKAQYIGPEGKTEA